MILPISEIVERANTWLQTQYASLDALDIAVQSLGRSMDAIDESMRHGLPSAVESRFETANHANWRARELAKAESLHMSEYIGLLETTIAMLERYDDPYEA